MNMRANIIALGLAFAVLTNSGCAVTHDQQTTTANSAFDAPIDDQALVSTIKARYAASDDLALSCIKVESLYGVVLLSGSTKSPEEKITAQQIAAQVDGVKAVHNEILIQADDTDQKAAPNCR